ncbi:TPA: replication protein [Legionella pneumophila]
MTILRINKREKNFLILDKTCLNESNLSWGAKGLHSYLMSLPQDWKIRVDDLKNRATNGRDSLRGFISELEQAGYISREKIRNEQTGKFGGMEYVVYELPQHTNDDENTPEPENPSADYPETDFQSPENPTLINNKYNNKTNNKGLNKTAAGNEQHAAAVSISQEHSLPESHPTTGQSTQSANSIIGEILTPVQKQRVAHLVASLSTHNSNPVLLQQEIEYCVLNKKHFTACGDDFFRKLNAIKNVISRGEWQRPAGLVLEAKLKDDEGKKTIERALYEAHAERTHFDKMMSAVDGDTQLRFKAIIERADQQILELQKQLHGLMQPSHEHRDFA